MLITQAEFARLAGVSRSAVKQAINNALITAIVEQGGKTLIEKNEGLQQYKNNSRRQRTPATKPPKPKTPDESGLEMLSWGQAPSTAEGVGQTIKPDPPKSDPANPSREALPEYGKSRARSEYEKANLLELQRKTQERELLRREDVQQAWSHAVNLTRTKLLGVPSTVKQRIPHLEVEEIEVITGLIREALDELAGGEVAA